MMLATAGRPSHCQVPQAEKQRSHSWRRPKRAAGGARRTRRFSSNSALKSPSPLALLKGQRSPPSLETIAQTNNKTALPETLHLMQFSALGDHSVIDHRCLGGISLLGRLQQHVRTLISSCEAGRQATSLLQIRELVYRAAPSQGTGDRSIF